MLRTPQNNGDRVLVSNRNDFRLALEAYNFHAEQISSQAIVMRRLGPDTVIFDGQLEARKAMTADFISQLQRDIRLA